MVSDIFGNSENLVLRISVGLENPTDTLKPKANLNRLKLIGKPLRVALLFQRTDAHRIAHFCQQQARFCTGFFCTRLQNGFDLRRIGHN